MAICNYNIHVKGRKQSVLMFYATIKSCGNTIIERECGQSEKYIMWFSGKCADECDLYGKETSVTAIDHNLLTEEQIRSGLRAEKFFDLSLRQKSELLGVEVLARSWSDEDNYDQIEHYRNGYFVGIISDFYRENNEFEFEF